MNKRRILRCLACLGGAAVLLVLSGRWLPAQPPNYDKLSAEDRQAFGQRFAKDIWPLLVKGGKDGCVGCHTVKLSKAVTALRFDGLTDDPQASFRMLVRDGFFLKGDAGSLHGRLIDPDKKRRMPPSRLPAWSETDIKIISDFANDLHQRQKP